MTSINSTSQTRGSSSSYVSKGVSGLASGMNTEEIVEAMTSDIQAKIDKVKKDQQKNEWRQDAYRAIISSLTKFQDKYFSYRNPKTNLLSSALYNCSKKVAQGANAGKISVNSTSNSADAAYKITSVSQLATRAKFTGTSGIGGDSISTGDISFADRTVNVAAGKEINIKYENTEYTITIPEGGSVEAGAQGKTMETLLNEALRQVKVEGSNATLYERLNFKADGDILSLGTVSSSDSRSFEITGGDADTLAALGFKVGDKGTSSSKITAASEVNVLQEKAFSLTGKKLTFALNSLEKTITFNEADTAKIMAGATDADKMSKMAEVINEKLGSAFGTGKISAGVSADGKKIDFTVTDPTSTLKVSSTSVDTMGEKGIFGIESGTTNRLDTKKTLNQLGITPTIEDKANPENNIYKITVNGKEFEFKGTESLSYVMSKINNDKEAGVAINYLNTTNKFTISADDYGTTGKVQISGSVPGDLASKLFGGNIDSEAGTAGTSKGVDLEMTIRYDGDTTDTTIVRNSNTVDLDGINFSVTGTFDSTSEAISFKSESDTEDTIKVIKEMAEDYNKILDSVNELVTTKSASATGKRNSAKYEPLTDAQKKEMTTEEIEQWEKKAKQGILFGDSTLSQLASSLRFAFSSIVGGSGFGKEIGITTASSYSGNGKITIDEDKLKEALTNNPDKVKAMFTATAEEAPNSSAPSMSGGFATRIKSVFESYAKETGAYKGKLVELAGIQNNPTTNDNYIARQQKILSSKLEYYKDLLTKRQDRYQRQFSSLEVYISKMNAQSSWLSSATSGA